MPGLFGSWGVKTALFGSKMAFLAFWNCRFWSRFGLLNTVFHLFSPLLALNDDGACRGPPYVPLQGPWVIKMSIMAIFLYPRHSKIGQISQIHGFLVCDFVVQKRLKIDTVPFAVPISVPNSSQLSCRITQLCHAPIGWIWTWCLR